MASKLSLSTLLRNSGSFLARDPPSVTALGPRCHSVRRHISNLSKFRPITADLKSSRSFLILHNKIQQEAFNSTESTKSSLNADETKSQTDSAAADGKSDAKSESPNENEQKLANENAELKAKHDELLDKYRRSIAENDNMRKRLTKQIDDAKIFGIQGFCKDLLDVADVLNKAIANVEPEVLAKESQYMKDMFEGLKLTESQLLQVFKRHGLTQENPLNEKFDPNKHEALFQIPAPDKDPNIVLDVQKIGYLLNGRTIRPALVGVSKK